MLMRTGMRITMSTAMVKKRSALLHRSSPRKRGPRTTGTKALDSRLRGNERETELASSALYRLMVWLSPAYPVGAFSYSSGIEWAVEAGDITDAGSLRAWLVAMLADGSGFCDAVLFAQAHRAADASALARLAWHLGNRHTEVQVVGTKLRIRRDHVLEEMLRGLGAALTPLQAPFDPEGGAHDAPAHGHSHGHAHHHEHGHG
jgi:hypothetical protein